MYRSGHWSLPAECVMREADSQRLSHPPHEDLVVSAVMLMSFSRRSPDEPHPVIGDPRKILVATLAG